MDAWKTFKDGFDKWEQATSSYLDTLLKSPAILQPAGATLSAWARAKKMQDEMLAGWWSRSGLPTRREQERVLHAINQLHSRFHDLEEQIEDLQDELEQANAATDRARAEADALRAELTALKAKAEAAPKKKAPAKKAAPKKTTAKKAPAKKSAGSKGK